MPESILFVGGEAGGRKGMNKVRIKVGHLVSWSETVNKMKYTYYISLSHTENLDICTNSWRGIDVRIVCFWDHNYTFLKIETFITIAA